MRPIHWVEGVVAPLCVPDVAAEQILPEQFRERGRQGSGAFLFHDWRYHRDGSPNQGFLLNWETFRDARILVAGANFGRGVAGEPATRALADFGFRAVVAPGFAEGFLDACYRTGIVPVALPAREVEDLARRAAAAPYRAVVDVAACVLQGEDGFCTPFHLDALRRRWLLEGLDEIARTVEHESDIARYEEPVATPPSWLVGRGEAGASRVPAGRERR